MFTLKKAIICTVSLVALAVAATNFFLATPPLKTGGISYFQKKHIQDDYTKRFNTKLSINDALTQGLLEADVTTGSGVKLKLTTDVMQPIEEGKNVLLNATFKQDGSDAVYASMNTMVFNAKKPAMVVTLTGDIPFKLADKLEKQSYAGSAMEGHTKLISEKHERGERHIKVTLEHDMSLAHLVYLISQDDDIERLATLKQSYLEQSHKMQSILQMLESSTNPENEHKILKEGSEVQVFFKVDKSTMDRGINIVYTPKN